MFLVIMCFKGSAVGALLAIPAAMAADAIDMPAPVNSVPGCISRCGAS
jgi:hypothetical protein